VERRSPEFVYFLQVFRVTESNRYAWTKDGAGNVSAAASAKVTIGRQQVTSNLDGNPVFTYDGNAKTVAATINPIGHMVTITYNGSPTAPTNAGVYTVVATVNEEGYYGSISGR